MKKAVKVLSITILMISIVISASTVFAASHSHKYNTQYICNDNNTHTIVKTCSCGKTTRKTSKHSCSTVVGYTYADNKKHNVSYSCKCGYVKSNAKLMSHNYKKGVCTKCGYNRFMSATNVSGTGVCDIYGGTAFHDWGIKKSCPKCNSGEWDYVGAKRIRECKATVWHEKTTVYHQQVKCRNCGEKYWNRCYNE